MVIKLASTVLVLSLALVGCSDSDSPATPSAPTQTNCTYQISSTTFSMAGSTATATLSVNAPAGCTWTVTNNNQSFVSVTSGTSGSGNGTVSFSVTENPGDARTGTLTIAGQNIVINQSSNDPLFGSWRGSIVKGAGCPATIPASVEWTGTFRRTSLSTTELVISIPSLLIFNQVIPITFNGSNITFGVQIDTLYSFAATLAGDRRSLSGTFSGGGCTGTWNGTRQ